MKILRNSSARFTPARIQPTKEQLDIQLCRDKTVLVEANAGAAKTTTLALRAGEELARGLSPEEILILVFTPEARDVMKRRLIEIGIPARTASEITVKTFDDFSSGVLNAFDGYEPKTITSLHELKPFIITALEHVATKYADQYDELDFSTHNIAITQLFDAQLSMKAKMSVHQDHDGMDANEIAFVSGITLTHWLTFLAYERLRGGALDEVEFRGVFDATYDLARRLIDSPELHAAIPACRLLLCDELHDLNEAAFRILMALLSHGQTYFVGAGDKDQVIHATLGADEQYLQHRFDSCGLGRIARLPLTATYRYGPHLALSAGRLMQKLSTSPLALNTRIERRYYEAGNHAECAKLVIEAVVNWLKNNQGSCAILIRDRHQSILIENALMREGIGYECPRMEKYLQRNEILFMRGMLAIALKNFASIKSLDVRRSIIEVIMTYVEMTFATDIDSQDIELAPDYQDYPDPLGFAISRISEHPDELNDLFKGLVLNSRSKGCDHIVEIVGFLEKLPEATKAVDALVEICKRLDIDSLIRRIYVDPYDASVIMKSIDGFISFAETSGMSIKRFSEWIGEAEILSRKIKNNSVVLECVANSKGMEFDQVTIPFLEIGEFPDLNSKYKQEKNLFYVGITRVKHELMLIMPNKPAVQSPFVELMAIDDTKPEASDAIASAMPVLCRTDLKVPYASKDEAKALGAKWDGVRKTWYVDAGVDLTPFRKWIE